MTRILLSFIVMLSLGLGQFALSQEIVDLSGVVELRSQLNAAWRPASLGDTLGVDASIRSFEGSVSLRYPNDDLIKLSTNSELNHQADGLRLAVGKAYVNAWNLDVNTQVRVTGEARIDANSEYGWRVAVLSGDASIGGLVTLKPAQQYVLSPEGDLTVSTYTELDPWYRNFTILGEGAGQVVGLQGQAELSYTTDVWQAAQIGDAFPAEAVARTAEDSWLEIKFDDGNIIRLQADSEVSLGAIEDIEGGLRQSVIELRYGKVWAIVETEDQPFQIETPGLIAGVRGTKFRVDAANDSEPALIKTFEGSVAGVVGFAEAVIEEGKQFEPALGVEELRLDALDLSNINRDRFLNPPALILNPIDTRVSTKLIEVSGETDPDTLVAFGISNVNTTDGLFSFERRLKAGFNLVEVIARAGPGGLPANRAVPVIKEGREIYLDAIYRASNTGISLVGVAPVGAVVRLEASFGTRETVANAQGRFAFSLPAISETITLEARLDRGESITTSLLVAP